MTTRTRPQDRLDFARLSRKATEQDLNTAREAVELIDQRGFGRGRRLLDDLEKALAELKSSFARRLPAQDKTKKPAGSFEPPALS